MFCNHADRNRQEEEMDRSLRIDLYAEHHRTILLENANQIRHMYLPTFPKEAVGPNECLLSTNIPG